MLKLFNKEHVAISALTNLKDYKIEYLLSGEDCLEFSFSISDEKIYDIEEEGYVRTKDNEYVIKAIEPSDNFKRFTAIVNVEDLVGKSISKFDTSNNNITDTIRLAIAGTGWILADNSITKRRTVRLKNTNALEVLREIRKVFRVDFRYDAINKIIYAYEQFGEDKGVYFSDELNLKSFSIPSDTYDYVTRLYPYGKDGLNISSINGGKEYIENFQYSNKVIELIWEDNRYTDVNSLKEDAEAKLDELSKPKRTYQAEISDLAKQSKEYDFLDFFLGDTITLLSKQEKFRDKQRIVKYIEYPNEPYNNTCELGNTTLTFEELQAENEAKNNVVDNITSDNGTVDGSKVDGISTEQIYDFEAEVGKIVDFTAINAEITNLKAQDVTITGKLTSIEGEFGTIKSNVSIIDKLTVTHSAEINELKGNSATFSGELSALSGKFGTVESEVAKIQTLVNGKLTSENIQSLHLTSASVTVENGFIKNAMIESLDVSKVNAGDISTNKFKIRSDNGGIEIVGATQQFKDKNNKIRIQMGQDTQGNFNFIIRGEDGTTTLIDHTGIKEKAIADDLIKNNMIAQDAVGEKQINYSSFITGFNKDTNTSTIKSTKIMLDNQNQTLDIAFSQLKTQADGTKSLTESHSTTIGVMQGQITTAINNTQIVKDGQTVLLKDDYNRTIQTIDSMNSIIGSHKSQISDLNSTVSSQGSSISQLKNQIALKVEQTDINNAINDIQIGARNILRYSGNFKNTVNGYWMDNGGGLTFDNSITYNGYNTIKTTVGAGISGTWYKLETNIEYTYSALIRCNETFTGNGGVPLHYWAGTNNTNQGKISIIKTDVTYPTANVWKLIYITFKLTGDGDSFRPFIYWGSGTRVFNIAYMKLEKGNKPTDFTVPQEDVDSSIDNIQTQVTTTNNKVATIETNLSSITQKVSSTETTLSSTTATANSALSKLTLNEQTKMNGIELLPQGYKSNSGVNYKLQYNKTTFSNNSINITGTEWIYTDFIKIDRTKPLYWKIALTVSSNNLYYFGIERYDSNKNVINNASNNATSYFKNATGQSGTFEGYWQETDTSTAYVRLRFLNDWNYTGTATAKITELSWKQLGALVIDDLTTEITTTNSKVSSIETNLSSITSRVSSTETTLATTTSTANSALSQANSNKSSISSLTTRISTAESKLTKDSLTTTIGSYYTTSTDVNGIITSKGYQTSSQVQQTVDALQVKFTQSGGYNLLFNGDFKNGTTHWSNTGFTRNTTSSSPRGISVYVTGALNTTKNMLQVVTLDPNQTSYTLSAYMHTTSSGSNGTTNPFLNLYCEVTNTDGTIDYYHIGNTSYDIWQKRSITFYKPSGKSFNYVRVYLFVRDTTKQVSFSQIMLAKGSLAGEFTPNPNEVYDGITTIDKDGITVLSSNVNSKTNMSANGFKITNTSTNRDVFKVQSNGQLYLEGEVYTYKNNKKSIFVGDNVIKFFNWNSSANEEMCWIYNGINLSNNERSLSLAGIDTVEINTNAYSDSGKKHIDFHKTKGITLYNNLNVNDWDLKNVQRINYGEVNDVWINNLYIRSNQVNTNMSSGTLWLNYWQGVANNGCEVKVGNGSNDGSYGSLYCQDFKAYGTKNSIVQTTVGHVGINAYETCDYYFGDIGETILDDEGYSYVYIDSIFSETVNTNRKYQVFLSVYGEGQANVIERHPTYFIIKGTPNIEVGYEIKAKRRGYEDYRLEREVNEFKIGSEHGLDLSYEEEKREFNKAIENAVEENTVQYIEKEQESLMYLISKTIEESTTNKELIERIEVDINENIN